jgi:hemolysin activation/secretion protein
MKNKSSGRRAPARIAGDALALACLLLALAAHAQTAPNAGQLLREAQPPQRPPTRPVESPLPAPLPPRAALALPSGVKVHVSAVTLTGVRTQPLQVLQALVADAVGQDLDLAGLQALADRITVHYRRAGYVLARAYVPAQEIEGGRVEIAVEEGRIGQVRLQADGSLPQATLAAHLTHVQEGQPLLSDALESDLLGLSDLPGVRVQSVLRPGQAVGTSDLDIQVSATRRVTGDVSLDNQGNRFTGENRLTGHVAVASPFLFGDSLDATAVYAGADYRYGRLAWQAPLAASGWQVGLAQSAMGYRLGKTFAALDASGHAADTTLYALSSLRRSRATDINLTLAYDHKRFDDAASGEVARKQADVGSASLGGRGQWLGGIFVGNVALTAGRLDLGSSAAAADALGHRTDGRYAKLGWQAGQDIALRELPHAGTGGISLRVAGQVASKNLDGSEKLALGGPQAVRAYPQGEASSDDAVIVNAEVYQNFGNVRAKVFGDAASGRDWHQAIAGDAENTRTLSGVGFGIDTLLPGQIALQAVAALRTGPLPTSDTDRNPRWWVQLSKTF